MIIVNFATEQFIRGQLRLARSIAGKCNAAFYSSYNTIKSPHHTDSPYQFKIHAMEKAFQQFPDENIFLWCDASLYLVGDLTKIENIIKQDGFFGEESGHYCYDWANAHCRKYHKLTKEEGLMMYSAGLTGVDTNNPLAMNFFKQWKASAVAGCFRGSWKDHRHDMVNASIIAQRLGFKYQRGGSNMAYIGPGYSTPQEGVTFHLQGIL